MFTCVLQHYVASTVLTLKPFSTFTEGVDRVRHMGMISVDRHEETASVPSMTWQITAEVGGRKLESEAWRVGQCQNIFQFLKHGTCQNIFQFLKHGTCQNIFQFLKCGTCQNIFQFLKCGTMSKHFPIPEVWDMSKHFPVPEVWDNVKTFSNSWSVGQCQNIFQFLKCRTMSNIFQFLKWHWDCASGQSVVSTIKETLQAFEGPSTKQNQRNFSK